MEMIFIFFLLLDLALSVCLLNDKPYKCEGWKLEGYVPKANLNVPHIKTCRISILANHVFFYDSNLCGW